MPPKVQAAKALRDASEPLLDVGHVAGESTKAAALEGTVLMLAVLIGLAALSLLYVYTLDDDRDGNLEDKAGGWAQDILLALAASLFLVSHKVVIPDRYWVFYIGTIMAYGLGGVGHLVENMTSPLGLTLYYVIMTLAFGGDAVRSAYGYGLPPSRAVRSMRLFTGVIFGTLCVCACLTLRKLIQGDPPAKLQDSSLGIAYKATQIGMGVVEWCGSLVWFWAVRKDLGHWALVPTTLNIAAWALVKFQPIVYAAFHIQTTISHQLAHYMQMVVLWYLHTINLKIDQKEKAWEQIAELFENLDRNRDGQVSLQELQVGIRANPKLGEQLSVVGVDGKDITKAFRVLDSNRDGKIAQKEFIRQLYFISQYGHLQP